MHITILGCGDSRGVPTITGHWGTCDPHNPKNIRTRPSILVETEPGHSWLIDASVDIRTQCLREKITHIDGILCTHAHFDHIGGIEELKSFVHSGDTLPIHSDVDTLDCLQTRCPYAFEGIGLSVEGYRPFLRSVPITGPFFIGTQRVIPFVQDHRYSSTLGFRFERFAYSTDVWQMPEDAFSHLTGLDVWIVDCLDIVERHTHSHLERTLSWIQRADPKRAILTHMGTQMDYDSVSALLPSHVCLAYDGMKIEV